MQYSGPSYQWVGVTEHGWGKVLFVNNGERLVFGLPMQTCLMAMAEKEKIAISSITDITALAKFFVSFKPKTLVEMGGFYIYLRQGQGIVIPPMYQIGILNAFNLDTCPTGDACVIPADIVESCWSLYWLCILYLCFSVFPGLIKIRHTVSFALLLDGMHL